MRLSKFKPASLFAMAVLYVAAGINHFIHPSVYVGIIPSWLPQKLLLSNIAGACEIFFGLMLLPNFSRRYAAWAIIFLLIAIFPANIQMAVDFYRNDNPYFWLTIARLPLQFLLIWWAYIFTKRK